MRTHPECAADECFVGNHNMAEHDECMDAMPEGSFRYGEVAYYLDGGKIPASMNIRPLIVKRSYSRRYNDLREREFSLICQSLKR